MKSVRRKSGPPAFALIEEATHLLRTAPAMTWLVYYLGTIPFTLGLLYFWADMSRSPFAAQHLAGATLGLAGLFSWMKGCQTVFARRLWAQATGDAPPQFNLRQSARILLIQTSLQPFGLFLIPLAAIPLLPFAWVYAVFQNLTVLATGDAAELFPLLKKSWKQASLWPGQNNLALAGLSAFAFCLLLNWLSVGFVLPELAKMLFGIRSVFTDSPYSVLNTTFLTGMIALTYLCLDPILKAFYVLRCFYGESLQSGEDLKAGLKPFAVRGRKAALGLVILLALFTPALSPAAAASPASSASAGSPLPPADLDRAINGTIHERKFTWRMPRQQIADEAASDGVIARFFANVGDMVRDWAHAVVEWLAKLLRKLFPHPHPGSTSAGGSGYGWIMSLEILLYGLVALALAVLVIFIMRLWRGRRKSQPVITATAVQPVPDLTDEHVAADQLPEDGWLQLARELLERGEFRLAMRALYLSSLSHLAARNLISIARFKSNHDYERELRRRAHALPGLLDLFTANLFFFERGWYGTYEISRAAVDEFSANVEKIKAAG